MSPKLIFTFDEWLQIIALPIYFIYILIVGPELKSPILLFGAFLALTALNIGKIGTLRKRLEVVQ